VRFGHAHGFNFEGNFFGGVGIRAKQFGHAVFR